MRTTLQELKGILKGNVCEIVFVRRRPQLAKTHMRRMICTLDDNILMSTNGRISLNFRPPANPLPYNAEAMGLLPVWDIFMQDWRMASMDYCDLVNTIKEDHFWEYFNNTLMRMSASEKINFMGT